MPSEDTKIISGHTHTKYHTTFLSKEKQIKASSNFYGKMSKRRSIRDYSDKTVPKEIIESIIRTAGTAPSGAHKQPWTFCVVHNKELKRQIRKAAEAEEQKSYSERMNKSWLQDLKPLGTNPSKPFKDSIAELLIISTPSSIVLIAFKPFRFVKELLFSIHNNPSARTLTRVNTMVGARTGITVNQYPAIVL